MARHRRMLTEAPQETLDFFIGRMDSSGRKRDPDAEGRMQGPAYGPQSPAIVGSGDPNLPQTVGVNADGPGSTLNFCGTPPDTMGAIGPTQFVSFVNCNIVSANKSTGLADGVLATTPNNFFTSVRSSSVSDPHVRYDRTSQRWFLFIIDVTFPNNRLLVAVSNTATITPSTTWAFFFVPTANGTHTNCLADYPTPGIDANAIYVGVNQFCGASLGTATYGGSDLFVIQKSSVLGAGPIHATAFFNIGTYTPQGVDNANPAATEGWVIGTSLASWSQLDLFRVSNPGSLTPTRSAVVNINTANQGDPVPQPHLGMTGATPKIDGSDNRLFAATYRDGSLWTAMTVGTTVSAGNCIGTAGAATATRNAAFWWEITGIPTGSTPAINQAGVVCDPAATNPNFYSYPTIAPSGQGHAAMGFTIAGNLTFLSAGTAGRLSGDTPSALQGINIYGPGVAAYNPSFDSGASRGYRRWGDYSFTGVDPCDDQTIWTIQEYTPVANQYGIRFAQLKAPPPATPASVSPPTVAAGQAAASVVITGTSTSGSGFSDTPLSLASEPCRTRIASAVSGVVVNSVTWNSPTQVTLSLDTTASTAGAKNVTITNPDGQSAAGVGILTITSGCTPPPTPTASNTGPYCAGATVSLSTPTVSGATYAWTGPNSFSSSLQNPTIPSATTAATGTYSVTVTVAGCTSSPGTTNVVVSPVPSTPTASNTGPYCAGATVLLSTPTVSGATYAWTGPNGFSSSSQNPTIPSATTAATGTYSVTVKVAGCTSAAGTTSVVVNPAPAVPVVTAPATVGAGSPNRTASVPAHAGSTYLWVVTNGAITSGQGTSQITFTAGAAGILTLAVTETNSGCPSAPGSVTVSVAPAGSAVLFYALPPCRVLDTRNPAGPLGGPALQASATRTFDVSTAGCGIPAGAVAISANIVVTNEAAPGYLVLFRSDTSLPGTSSISFSASRTRANNLLVGLASSTPTFAVFNGSAGTVDFILDVNGYFQ